MARKATNRLQINKEKDKNEIGSSFEYKCGSVRASGLLVRAWCSMCSSSFSFPVSFTSIHA